MTTLPSNSEPETISIFGVKKDDLLRGLSMIQQGLCSESYSIQYPDRYGSCICKFGFVRLLREDGRRFSRVHTGCPEVAMAFQIIKHLSPEEYARICRRAGILIVDLKTEMIEIPSQIDTK